MTEPPAAFAITFADLRRRRRIPTRGFDGIPSSYISAIEKNNLLPRQVKLDALAKVFKQVAEEQGADPEEDARLLTQAHGRALFERLDFDPELADALTMVATKLRGDTRLLAKAKAKLAGLDRDKREEFVNELVDHAIEWSTNV